MSNIKLNEKELDTPVWDPVTKKLKGHYEFSKVKTIINLLDRLSNTTDKSLIDIGYLDKFTKTIAKSLRIHTKDSSDIPPSIKHWCKRIFILYTNNELRASWENKIITTSVALDLADYAHIIKYKDLYKKTLSGNMRLSTFRKLKKERKNII